MVNTFFRILNYELMDIFSFYPALDSKSCKTNSNPNLISILFMSLMIFIYFASIFKILFVIIYFFIYTSILDLIDFAKNHMKYSSIWKKEIISNLFKTLWKKVRRTYTYNFYSFDSYAIGFYLILIFLIFIFLNGDCLTLFLEGNSCENNNENSSYLSVIDIISSLTYLIIQIFVPFFYIFKDLRKILIFTHSAFFFNLLICIIGVLVIYYEKYQFGEKKFMIIINLVHLLYSLGMTFLNTLATIAIYKYKKKEKNSRLFMKEKIRFYQKFSKQLDSRALEYEVKQSNSENSIDIKNIYINSEGKSFFCKRNKFHYLVFLKIIFSCFLILNYIDFIVTLYSFIGFWWNYSKFMQSVVAMTRTNFNYFGVMRTIFIIIMSSHIFLKLNIRKSYLN